MIRRLVAALILAAVVVSLAGCSSSSPPVPAPVPVTPSPAANPSAVGADGKPLTPTTVSETNKLSPPEGGANALFPSTPSRVPTVVVDHIAAKQPMIVLFYDPGQSSSKAQRTEIDAAIGQYRGLIDLVAFDVTGALPDPVTKKANTDKAVTDVANLVQDLKIGFTPYVVLVDKRGVMTGRYRGFVDRAMLQREILKATQ
jgi:hypothetical protein